jgi:hypothetical protein
MTTDDRDDIESSNPAKSFKVGEVDRLSGFFTPVWESKRRLRSESPVPSSSAAASAPISSRGATSERGATSDRGAVSERASDADAAEKAAAERAVGKAAAEKAAAEKAAAEKSAATKVAAERVAAGKAAAEKAARERAARDKAAAASFGAQRPVGNRAAGGKAAGAKAAGAKAAGAKADGGAADTAAAGKAVADKAARAAATAASRASAQPARQSVVPPRPTPHEAGRRALVPARGEVARPSSPAEPGAELTSSSPRGASAAASASPAASPTGGARASKPAAAAATPSAGPTKSRVAGAAAASPASEASPAPATLRQNPSLLPAGTQPSIPDAGPAGEHADAAASPTAHTPPAPDAERVTPVGQEHVAAAFAAAAAVTVRPVIPMPKAPARPPSRAAKTPTPVPSSAALALKRAGKLDAEAFLDPEPDFRGSPATSAPLGRPGWPEQASPRAVRATQAATELHEKLRAKLQTDSVDTFARHRETESEREALQAAAERAAKLPPDLYPSHVLRTLRRTIHLSTPLPEDVRQMLEKYRY